MEHSGAYLNVKGIRLEVCIDSLESAVKALEGGADELEVCSSLTEGGLTPSPGLVQEILKLVKNQDTYGNGNTRPKVNLMIRCRGGSDFVYTEPEMKTMLSDIEVYKEMDGIDRFVFGALTDNQEIDKIKCTSVIRKAHPIPVTFHRAFDLCKEPKAAVEHIIDVGFTRILTSGQKESAADITALELLQYLLKNYNRQIEIMPGAGINCDNAGVFIKMGFTIIHSSCKKVKKLPNVGDLCLGGNTLYVTDKSIVKKIKEIVINES